MSNEQDKVLADALVERGILKDRAGDVYEIIGCKGREYLVTIKEAVRDPRVAMQCLKRRLCKEDVDASMGMQDGKWWVFYEAYGNLCFEGESESLERAIIQAYVESDDE